MKAKSISLSNNKNCQQEKNAKFAIQLEDINCCEVVGVFILNLLLSFLFPIYFCLCFFIVEPGKAIIFELFGKPREIYKESGCHCSPSVCCRTLKEVNMAI
jgi:hypothetical protein